MTSRGFTLIQLLIALGIIGTVAAIGTGVYVKTQDNAHDARVKADVANLNRAIDTYLLSNGRVPIDATPVDVLTILKSIPDARLAKETPAFRLLVSAETGINPYTEADGRLRMALQAGRFAAVPAGDGWLLDKSGNVQVTEESRRVVGAKFASVSNWIWEYDESSAGATTPNAPATVGLTTTAPLVGSRHRITSPGTYEFTATTDVTSGILTLTAGPYGTTREISPGAQSVGRTISVGLGARYIIAASATVTAHSGGKDYKELTVEVDVPGITTAQPVALELFGPNEITVRRNPGSVTQPYLWTLRFNDGTERMGTIPQVFFYPTSYVASETTAVSTTQEGLTASKLVTVNYWPTHMINVAVRPEGAGSVDIPAAPAGGFDKDEIIRLVPRAGDGFQFLRWEGGASGSSTPLVHNVTADTTITAVFEGQTFGLRVLASGNGTVQVLTPPIGTNSQGLPAYAPGTVVSLQPQAGASATFGSWDGPNGSEVSGGTNATIVMDTDKSVMAIFDASTTFTLTTSFSDPAAGTPPPAVSDLQENATVDVAATLNQGWSVVSATVSGGATITGSSTSRRVTMGKQDAHLRFEVEYSPDNVLTVSTSGEGTATGSGSYPANAPASITVTPADGWVFAGFWGTHGSEVEGTSSGVAGTQSGSITMNSSKDVTAVFTQRMVTTTWGAQLSGGSGTYQLTEILIFRKSDNTLVGSRLVNGGSQASIQVTLPVGSYIIRAFGIGEDGTAVNTEAELVVE